MNEKKYSGGKLDKFFAGKGFYIVLFLCIAVIGVSSYYLFADTGTDVDTSLSQTVLPEIQNPPVIAPAPKTERPPAANDDPPAAEMPEEEEEPAILDSAPAEVEVWSEQSAEAATSAHLVWPLDGEITLPFSVTSLIYNPTLGDWRTNDNVSLAAPLGTQVVAVSSGLVTSVTHDDLRGMSVIIEHAGGLQSVYSNLAAVPTVYEGDSVVTGEVIGAVGATAPGETTENSHLILKILLDGQPVNPGDYLPGR